MESSSIVAIIAEIVEVANGIAARMLPMTSARSIFLPIDILRIIGSILSVGFSSRENSVPAPFLDFWRFRGLVFSRLPAALASRGTILRARGSSMSSSLRSSFKPGLPPLRLPPLPSVQQSADPRHGEGSSLISFFRLFIAACVVRINTTDEVSRRVIADSKHYYNFSTRDKIPALPACPP
jgi:hypothetical protein